MKIKSRKHVWFVIFSLMLIGFSYASSQNFWKATDPADSRFKIEKFDFDDYRNHDDLAETLAILLPIGTLKKDVEKLLVTYGGAMALDLPEKKLNLALGGGNITKAERRAMDLKIDLASKQAQSKILYNKAGKSPIFVGWYVYVFYDSEQRVQQIVTLNKPIF